MNSNRVDEAAQPFRIADFKVVPLRNEVITPELEAVKLSPLAMNLLVFLSDRAGEVVTTEELMAGVWGNRVVGDNALYNAIGQLRRVFRDQKKPHRIFVTVPKRGYRLALPVSPETLPASGRGFRVYKLPVAAGVLLIALTIGWYKFPEGDNSSREVKGGTDVTDRVVPPAALEQHRIGRLYLQQGTRQSTLRAANHFQNALYADANYAEAMVGLCDAFLMQVDFGDQSINEASEQCIPLLERATLLSPRSADAFAAFGRVKYHDKQWEQASEAFDEALRLDPDHFAALLWSGVLLRESGEYERALARHAHAAKLAPLSAVIQRNLGLDLLGIGDIHSARLHFERALALEPEYESSGMEQLGHPSMTRERAEAVVRWSEEHRLRSAQFPLPLISIALVRHALGDAEGARADLEAAQALNADLPYLYYAWGVVHFNAGDYESAIRALRKRAEMAEYRDDYRLHPIILGGLLGRGDAALEELGDLYDALRHPEQIPVEHFAVLQSYALFQRLGGDARIDASLARLRELLPGCELCDAMTQAELLALEGDHALAETTAQRAINDGWIPNHQVVPWTFECNPFFTMLPRSEQSPAHHRVPCRTD